LFIVLVVEFVIVLRGKGIKPIVLKRILARLFFIMPAQRKRLTKKTLPSQGKKLNDHRKYLLNTCNLKLTL